MRWKVLGALLLAATLVAGAAAAEPRIAGPISYIQPKSQGRQLQAKAQAAAHDTVATTQSAAQGSWWVPDASEQQAIASQGTVSQAAVKKQNGAKTEGEKAQVTNTAVQATGSVTSVQGQNAKNAAATESAMHNVFTLKQDTGDRQIELGNLFLAAKISPLAVSPKSFQESKPNMPDSTQIDPSHYPSAQLEGMPATAWESASAFAPTAAAPEPDHASAEATLQSTPGAVSAPAGQLAVNPKVTPRLPPPPPPMQQNTTNTTTVSSCSGYVTKEEILAGLEYAAGKEYLPFDPCWDVRLAALKNYYGTPTTHIFPFAFLNPGGYFSNVTFWINALKDYELGKAPYIMIPTTTSTTNTTGNSTSSGSLSVPIGADGVSSVTPPATPPADAPTATGFGINWYGGPVLNNKAGIVIYYIWYGGWGNLNNKGTASRPTTVKVLTDLAQSLGGTPWFNIGTTYTDGNGPVVNAISYGGRAGITAGSKCWQGRTLTNDQIFTSVDCAIQNKLVPYATNAVYLVMGASNVKASSGMCVNYCGWHTYGFDSQNRQTLFGFIGSPLPCLNACTAQGASNVLATPNYNAEADGMASIVSHELVETASDPLINAWYTSAGYENADLCAWTFSSSTFPAGGGLANLRWNCPAAAAKLGCTSRYYLIQQNWVNSSPAGRCALHK